MKDIVGKRMFFKKKDNKYYICFLGTKEAR